MREKLKAASKKILIFFVITLVISSCGNLIEPPNSEKPAPGTGWFSLVIGGLDAGRTIVPITGQNDFALYTLEFFAEGENTEPDLTVERTNSNLSMQISLKQGIWDLYVSAYMDAEQTKPAAYGQLSGIIIDEGIAISRSITLEAIIDGGSGTFNWNINYPANVVLAGMTITPFDEIKGTPEQTLYFAGAEPLVDKNGSIVLNTGYYRAVFNLTNSEQYIVVHREILHIYQNMESFFDFSFEDNHFTLIFFVTSLADSGEGSLRQLITDAPAGSTIIIDNDEGTIALSEQLTVNSSVAIEGNGVSITRDSAWTSVDANSQLLHISNSDAAVKISRVHFKDGRATNYGAAIMNKGNLILESCIFSNNLTSNILSYGGAIYNNGSLNVRGCTFYGNSAGSAGGAVYNSSGTLTLQGNLFFGNTGQFHPIVENIIGGTVTSNGYNVSDKPLGNGSSQSGWTAAGTDRYADSLPAGPATFKPLAGRRAVNVISSLPVEYPELDFYGDYITDGAAAGAIQTIADGYCLDLSVNKIVQGSVSMAPLLDADGLANTLTLTAEPAAGCRFEYWLINGSDTSIANPLHITLTDHTQIYTVFGIKLRDEYVKKLAFTEQTATVNFDNLISNDIYLVKVNKSNSLVNAPNTGIVNTVYPDLPPMDHEAAMRFNADPPPIDQGVPRRSRDVFNPPVVGDKRYFWVETYYDSGVWIERQATLRATGQYGNIWIMNENFTTRPRGNGKLITSAQAQTIAGKFDLIYPVETNLLGFEYGGGPDGDGGMDSDPKIQILFYDIVDNTGTVKAGGFFWSKDHYSKEVNDTWSIKSNQAEMFYVNASTVNTATDYVYSILVHEFQHMINFNEKSVKKGISSSTWFNEMLSMMTEDVVLPLIGIAANSQYHPTQQRMPVFIETYNQTGVTEWNTLELSSYAKGYAFGAYLLRNYGGPELLQKILANNLNNIESITSVLDEFSTGMDFEQALTLYSEAMIFSGLYMPDGIRSFDKTVTGTVNNVTYTAYGFDIWNMERYSSSIKGPLVFDLTPINMRPYSLSVHSANNWKNKTGNFSITLEKPADANIVMFLMVK